MQLKSLGMRVNISALWESFELFLIWRLLVLRNPLAQKVKEGIIMNGLKKFQVQDK